MRVAHALSSLQPNQLEQGGYYKDVHSGKWREFDVQVEWQGEFKGLAVAIKVCIECKRSDRPWVVFVDDASSTSSELSGSFFWNSINVRSEGVDLDQRQDFARAIEETSLGNFHFSEDIGSFVKAAHGKEDEPHEAMLQAISAARGLAMEDIALEVGQEQIIVSVPVVVTDSPLFACRLNTLTGEFILEERDQISVRGPRDDYSVTALTVRLCTPSGLPKLAEQFKVASRVVGR